MGIATCHTITFSMCSLLVRKKNKKVAGMVQQQRPAVPLLFNTLFTE